MPQEHSFSLPCEVFDLDLIGLSPADVGSGSVFKIGFRVSCRGVRQLPRQGPIHFQRLDSKRRIEVKWTKDRGFKEPKDRAMELLQSGKVAESVPLLWTLHQEHSDDTGTLYNLGVACSELQRAIAVLRRLVEIKPGVRPRPDRARRRLHQDPAASLWRRALPKGPQTRATQSLGAAEFLGACLLKQGKADEAIPVLDGPVRVSLTDPRSINHDGLPFGGRRRKLESCG